MIWRLMNKLFGWHYIYVECGYHKKTKKTRVKKLGNKFYYECEGKVLLIKKAKFSNEINILPLSMSQDEFNKMLDINLEEDK